MHCYADTQATLAELLNVDPTTVSRWGRGRDQPALGILRRPRSLVTPMTGDIERAHRLLIDTSDKFVVLYDHKYRLLHSSRLHRALLRLDASELYGGSFEQFQSESQAAIVNSVGGPRGWIKNGIMKVEATLLRKPAKHLGPAVQSALLRDCETPMVEALPDNCYPSIGSSWAHMP